MNVPEISTLAHDARLTGIARRWLGETAVPYRATLFDKSATSNWLVVLHQDTALPLASRFEAPGWGPWSEKEGVLYAHARADPLGGSSLSGSTSTILGPRTGLFASFPEAMSEAF